MSYVVGSYAVSSKIFCEHAIEDGGKLIDFQSYEPFRGGGRIPLPVPHSHPVRYIREAVSLGLKNDHGLIDLIVGYASTRFAERPLFRAYTLSQYSSSCVYSSMTTPTCRAVLARSHIFDRAEGESEGHRCTVSLTHLESPREELLTRGRRVYADPHHILHDGASTFVFVYLDSHNSQLWVEIERRSPQNPEVLVRAHEDACFELNPYEKLVVAVSQKEQGNGQWLISGKYDLPTQSFLLLTNAALFFYSPRSKRGFEKISFPTKRIYFVAGVNHDKLVAVRSDKLYFIENFRGPERRYLRSPTLPADKKYGLAITDFASTHLCVMLEKNMTPKGNPKWVQWSIQIFAFPKIDFRGECLVHKFKDTVTSFVADDSTLILYLHNEQQFHFWDIVTGKAISSIQFDPRHRLWSPSDYTLSVFNSRLICHSETMAYVCDFPEG